MIQPRARDGYESRCLKHAPGKCLTALRDMTQLEPLAFRCQQDGVVADPRATTHCMNPDLVGRTRSDASLTTAAKNALIVTASCRDLLRHNQRRS